MAKFFYSRSVPGMTMRAQRMMYAKAHHALVNRAQEHAKIKKRAKNKSAKRTRVFNRRKGVAS